MVQLLFFIFCKDLLHTNCWKEKLYLFWARTFKNIYFGLKSYHLQPKYNQGPESTRLHNLLQKPLLYNIWINSISYFHQCLFRWILMLVPSHVYPFKLETKMSKGDARWKGTIVNYSLVCQKDKSSGWLLVLWEMGKLWRKNFSLHSLHPNYPLIKMNINLRWVTADTNSSNNVPKQIIDDIRVLVQFTGIFSFHFANVYLLTRATRAYTIKSWAKWWQRLEIMAQYTLLYMKPHTPNYHSWAHDISCIKPSMTQKKELWPLWLQHSGCCLVLCCIPSAHTSHDWLQRFLTQPFDLGIKINMP